MMLLFWMTMSMLGGLILLPAILVQFKPKFVFGRSAPAAAHAVAGSSPETESRAAL
jgi:hypothetical protein